MLKTKPYENVYEELMLYLEVHDPQKFRRKAKGVQVVPFAMKDFYYRIAKDERQRINQRKQTKLSASEIRQKVEEMRERREREARQRELQSKRAKRNEEEKQKEKLQQL